MNTITSKDANGAAVPANRVGFVRLPIKGKIGHPRDDDDQNDGYDGDANWHNWHDHADSHDGDDDGCDDDYDSPSGHENIDKRDAAPLQPGQSADYPMTASPTSLALIAKAEADDPLAQIGIDIINTNGVVVASSVPTPGVAVATLLAPAAGNYTCRVHNYSVKPINHTPTLVVREPLDTTADSLVP